MSTPQEIKLHADKTSLGDSVIAPEDEIRVRAYELFQQRGGEEGHANEDWLQAEQEISRRKSKLKAA
jgi:hypothetical protein